MKIYKKVLDNNMTIAIAPMSKSLTVTAGFFVKAGGRNETDENNGIAHFLEHMMFKGTVSKTSHELITEMSIMGIDWNAYTTNDETVYYMNGDSIDTKRILKICIDIYMNSSLPIKEIEKEKKVIIEERRLHNDNPFSKIWRMINKKMFKGTSLERDLIGSENNINNFRRSDFINFRKQYYQPCNSVFVIAGNVNPKLIMELISKPLSKIPNTLVNPDENHEEEVKKILKNMLSQDNAYIEVKSNFLLQQAYVIIIFPMYDLYMDFYNEIDIISDMLTKGLNSRLNNALRENEGITYGISSSVIDCNGASLFTIQFVAHPNQLEIGLKIILKELKKLKRNGINNLELKKIIAQRKNEILFKSTSSYAVFEQVGSSILWNHGSDMVIEENIVHAKKYLRNIKKVSSESIAEIAKKIFKQSKLNIFMYGNIHEEKFDSLNGIL